MSTKKSKKPRTDAQKLQSYELCLDAIANEVECTHPQIQGKDPADILLGSGAILTPPCPVCLAWCAMNPEKAEANLPIAARMWKQVVEDQKRPKIELVKG